MSQPDASTAAKRIDRMHSEVMRKNFFQILGVDKDTEPERIKASYHLLAKKWHSDAYTGVGIRPETKAKLDEIFQKIGEAYETLTTPAMRQEYMILVDRQQKGLSTDVNRILFAEQLFDETLLHVKKRDWNTAMEKVNEAIENNPDDPLFVATKGWVHFQLNKRNDKQVKEAVGLLKESFKRQQNLPQAYSYLGQIYFAKENVPEARKWFKKCLEWDPQNVEAARLLRLVNSREEKKSSGLGGFFAKLFGGKKK